MRPASSAARNAVVTCITVVALIGPPIAVTATASAIVSAALILVTAIVITTVPPSLVRVVAP
jgi:hypothetical protein